MGDFPDLSLALFLFTWSVSRDQIEASGSMGLARFLTGIGCGLIGRAFTPGSLPADEVEATREKCDDSITLSTLRCAAVLCRLFATQQSGLG